MLFKESKSLKVWGKIAGCVVGYFIFTTILFFILVFMNKIPVSWSYLHIIAITLLISLAGGFLNWYLK